MYTMKASQKYLHENSLKTILKYMYIDINVIQKILINTHIWVIMQSISDFKKLYRIWMN